jgi:hypothetical protein
LETDHDVSSASLSPAARIGAVSMHLYRAGDPLVRSLISHRSPNPLLSC